MAFTVLTYNVKMAEAGLDADLDDLSVTRLKNAKRAKAILDEIVDMSPRPDVVVFTELFARTARDVLVEGPREHVWFAQVGPRSGDLRDHGYEVTERPGEDELRNGGVLIASRHPIERSGSRIFGLYAGGSGPLQQAKGVVHAAVDVRGVTHHVFGTHLQSGCDARELRVRRQQIDALGWIADRRTPASGRKPVVLAGDFNVGTRQTGRCAALTVAELRGRLDAAGLDVRARGSPGDDARRRGPRPRVQRRPAPLAGELHAPRVVPSRRVARASLRWPAVERRADGLPLGSPPALGRH